MKKFFTNRKFNFIYSIAAVFLMWLTWIICYYAVGNELLIPSFSDTMVSFGECLSDARFWTALGNSILRTLGAFAFSFLIAALCAALSLFLNPLRSFFQPLMVFIRTLPTMAAILLVLKVSFGNKTLASVIVTSLVLFPMLYSQFLAAFDEVSSDLREMAKVYGLKKRDRFFKIELPLATPPLLSQTGANLSLGIKVMLSAEVIAGAANGLGYLMQESSLAAGIAELVALTLVAVVVGLFFEVSFYLVSRFTIRWKNDRN